MKTDKKLIVGGAIGNCVHVAGIYNYLQIAQQNSYQTVFLGSAVDPVFFAEKVKKLCPEIVCVSYRLTASALFPVLESFFNALGKVNAGRKNIRFYFGGTPETIETAKKFKQFTRFFQGEEAMDEIFSSLDLNSVKRKDFYIASSPADNVPVPDPSLKNRLSQKTYFPMIRHHFGLPTMKDTLDGIRQIADSGIVDIISIATDQNAQEFFFSPEQMNPLLDGAGGVPVRTENDLLRIYDAAGRGNFPLLRIYSGTRDLLKWAEMSLRTINNAWGAIPLFWYSSLDGRSKRSVEEAIKEHQVVIKWYADHDIPVEINDSHHWSLRDAPDVMAVVDAYISAYNAKKLGVKTYIAQFMFNTPRLTSGKMDLAKMMAKDELISGLVDNNFSYLKQVRAGLTHFSIDQSIAKGQLAASSILSMAMKPHILHVVSYSEADHAALPHDVIESVKIAKGVLKNCMYDFPDLTVDPVVQKRKDDLMIEAGKILGIMIETGSEFDDPLISPKHLSKLVLNGFLDAPHLKGNPGAKGVIKTMPVNGGYEIVDENNKVVSAFDYVSRIIEFRKKED
ncbi:MAG TPA: methionine synthase [bacterium]|nr:methionine synthase [bacterium]